MPPLFQVMSLPVSTLAANEMATRVSMNTPALTHACDEGGKTRDAKRPIQRAMNSSSPTVGLRTMSGPGLEPPRNGQWR